MKDNNSQKSSTQKVGTPLRLLQAMSHSLLEHLELACGESLLTAEKQLRKLEKQQVKLQLKLDECQQALDAAIAAGKMKAREKRTHELAELQVLLGRLQDDHRQLLEYVEGLRREIAQTLELGQDIVRVADTAGGLLRQRSAGALPEPVVAEQDVTLDASAQLAAEESLAAAEIPQPVAAEVVTEVIAEAAPEAPAARPARPRRSRRRTTEG